MRKWLIVFPIASLVILIGWYGREYFQIVWLLATAPSRGLVVVAAAGERFEPGEAGVKKMSLRVDPPSAAQRRLEVEIGEYGLDWKVRSPEGRELTVAGCEELPRAKYGVPLRLCQVALGNEQGEGLYQLELRSLESASPTSATFRYLKLAKWSEAVAEPGKQNPKAWVQSDVIQWPEVGKSWRPEFELQGEVPLGKFDVETTVEYLPSMPGPSSGKPERTIYQNEIDRTSVEKIRFDVELKPEKVGALRVSYRVRAKDGSGWSAVGSSRFLNCTKKEEASGSEPETSSPAR
jgi:hypothetical protein